MHEYALEYKTSHRHSQILATEKGEIIMKKSLCLVLTMIMIAASLMGCGGKQDGKAEDQNNAKTRLDMIKESGKLVVGTSPDFAPSEFIDNSSGKAEYVGCDIEFAKYIADALGVELEIKAMEFSAIQQAIQSGNVDIGLSGFAYTEKRAEAMELTDKFNIKDNGGYQGVLVLKENEGKFKTKEDFKGKKLAGQNASLQQNLIQSQLTDVEFQPVTSIADGVMMVVTGKVVGLAVDSNNGESLIHNYPEVGIAEFKFDYGDEGNVIGIKKGETELLEAVNKIIADVNEKGLYEQWKDDAVELAKTLGIDMEE